VLQEAGPIPGYLRVHSRKLRASPLRFVERVAGTARSARPPADEDLILRCSGPRL